MDVLLGLVRGFGVGRVDVMYVLLRPRRIGGEWISGIGVGLIEGGDFNRFSLTRGVCLGGNFGIEKYMNTVPYRWKSFQL